MTPHNKAEVGEIAKIVIMPGDPQRAKFIAEHYLDNYRLVNDARCMYAYTGKYKGVEITVMAHGMGMAGAGIYFYELFNIYGVEKIIRIGSCITYKDNIDILDLIICDNVYTESNYAYLFSKNDIHLEYADKDLVSNLRKIASLKNLKVNNGTMLCSDVFDAYVDYKFMLDRVSKIEDVVGADMESFALLHIANQLNKKAACIFTVVDSICVKKNLTVDEREKSLLDMIEVSLDSILL